MSDQIEEDENKEIGRKEAEADTFGFDGLGTSEADYAVGKVVALAQAGDGAVLFLGLVCATMDFQVFFVTSYIHRRLLSCNILHFELLG